MTIRHLTVFAAVAEQGSMSAAAKHLYLSQPTVSQAIRELEAHYNGLLFERLGKKLYLTERGKLLLPHAREMIRQFQQLEELMQNQGQSSTLKLGSTLTVGTCLTPSIILDLQKKIPDLDVYSFVTNTQNIEQKLLRSELDAAVVEGEIHSPDLVVLPIIDDCLAFAAESYPASVPGELGLDSLPLVAHPITVILVKANTRSAATKRLRKRIQLAMMLFHQSLFAATNKSLTRLSKYGPRR